MLLLILQNAAEVGTESSFDFTGLLRILAYLATTISGFVALSFLILALIKRKEWKRKIAVRLKPIEEMAIILNQMMGKFVPRLLEHLVTDSKLPASMQAQYSEVLAAGAFSYHSAKRLNKVGLTTLNESGIGKIIDDNLDEFIHSLESYKVSSQSEVESRAYEVLLTIRNSERDLPIMEYVYKNPEKSIDVIFFVGSIYLRDKFIDLHSELKDEENSKSQNVTENS